MRSAVFLDRDGTINEEVGYLHRIEDFRLLPGAAEGIRAINRLGFVTVMITNQAGIGRGYYTERDVARLHEHMLATLMALGARIDAVYYCPHHPADQCACRKPAAGLFERAAHDLNLDLSASIAIGDKLSDLTPVKSLGGRTILVLTGYGYQELEKAREAGWEPDFVAADLFNAAQWIAHSFPNEASDRLAQRQE